MEAIKYKYFAVVCGYTERLVADGRPVAALLSMARKSGCEIVHVHEFTAPEAQGVVALLGACSKDAIVVRERTNSSQAVHLDVTSGVWYEDPTPGDDSDVFSPWDFIDRLMKIKRRYADGGHDNGHCAFLCWDTAYEECFGKTADGVGVFSVTFDTESG